MALWMPGVEHQSEGNGGSMVGGPPRAVWHITWDRLGKGGKMPSFDAIASYLREVNYCPHLMWDPWTGRIVQFYAADESARALENAAGGVETNRQGSHCIQVEVFFSPGAVVGGKRYDSVAETPCKGLDGIVAWMRSLGIPDRWPNGWPQWTNNSRNQAHWRTEPGHYGHCHVPENSHSDPGPMPKSMFKEADDVSAEEVWNYPIDTGNGGKPWRAKSVLGNLEKDGDKTQKTVEQVIATQAEHSAQLAAQGAKLDQILAALQGGSS